MLSSTSLELTGDRRRRERRELPGHGRIEPFDSLDEVDQRDLTQVLDRLSAVREASGEELRQTQMARTLGILLTHD